MPRIPRCPEGVRRRAETAEDLSRAAVRTGPRAAARADLSRAAARTDPRAAVRADLSRAAARAGIRAAARAETVPGVTATTAAERSRRLPFIRRLSR